MIDAMPCGGCGKPMPAGGTICLHCGWDLSAVLARPPRPPVARRLLAGGWRLPVYGLLLALPIVGFLRLQATGPGPDLPTTLRWVVLGDGGRAAELLTIHRMHEIGSAASRYMVRENELPSFDGDWASALAPSATAAVRGWIPLLFLGADSELAPASVREMYEVRAVDGWGRPYRVQAMVLPRDRPAAEQPLVAADLEAGLQTSFFDRGLPDLDHGEWLRLELVSDGRDREPETGDDLHFLSYIQVGHVFRLLYDPGEVQQRVERAYTVGRQYFRLEGSRFDLVDARLLAEFRLTSIR